MLSRSLAKIQLRDYVGPDGSVDWKKLFKALGIDSEREFRDVLQHLYMLDWRVATIVNEVLLELIAGRSLEDNPLPLEPPTMDPLAWLHADKCCLTCPGSEVISYNNFSYPRCSNVGRVDRYTECVRYRENLESGKVKPEELAQRDSELMQDLKDYLNVYRTKRGDEEGHITEVTRADKT